MQRQVLASPAGFLFVDKPSGITSHDVVYKIRKLTGVKKIGHTGTLDPLATGLLIVLVGRTYTKQQATFLKLDKTYQVTGRLGVTTDTYDVEGTVIDQKKWTEIKHLSEALVKTALVSYRGEITQQVPIFSAVKVSGTKLYELARSDQPNESVTLPSREVTITKLSLLDFNHDAQNQEITFSLEVACSSGTYIRSLVHDIGRDLGVGATVTSLRRTNIADHSVSAAVILKELTPQNIKKHLHQNI